MYVYALEIELQEKMMINDEVDLEKVMLPVGQMTGDGGMGVVTAWSSKC